MATPRSQRIIIWVIAIVMILGTVGSFIAMALGTQNQATDKEQLQKASSEYQTKVDAQTKELSDKYFSQFSQYETIPTAFETSEVKELLKNDLLVGDGAEIKADTAYNAYYIGWNPKGVVFDKSIADGVLKQPFPSYSVGISGWSEGVIGMKIGGVRELTIPSDKAYGETGNGEDIPPNTPLKFIIMTIPKVPDIPVPQILLDYYQTQAISQ